MSPQEERTAERAAEEHAAEEHAARERRSNRVWLIVIVVGGVIMTIAAIVAAILMNRIIEEAPVPAWARKVGEGADILLDAQSAPGVRELQALGCRDALILDVERTYAYIEKTDASAPPPPEGVPIHAAVCTSADAIACDEIARVVAAKAKLRGDFAALVQDRNDGRTETRCAEHYDVKGAHLGGFDPAKVPLP